MMTEKKSHAERNELIYLTTTGNTNRGLRQVQAGVPDRAQCEEFLFKTIDNWQPQQGR